MQWLRWYHGTASDMKFGRISRQTGQTRERVVFVWAMILENASDSDERGTFDIEADDIADILHCDTADIEAIMSSMRTTGMLDGNLVCAWEKRQPARDDSAVRQRRKRERDADVTRTPRDSDAHVTPPDTEQIQNRTEEPPVVPQGGRTKGRRFNLEALPEDWRQWARENGHGEPEKEFDRFRDYWTAQPGQKGVKADWLATWRNWIRRTVDEGKAPPVTDVPVSKGPRRTITLRWHGGDLTNYRQRVRSATGTGFPVWLDRLIPEAPGVTSGPEPPEGVMAELSRWADRYDVTFERAA